MSFTHLDLFSGIGGFALAADRVWPGIEHIFVDNDPFCQAVLRKHWPNSKIYGDIKQITWLPQTHKHKKNGENETRTRLTPTGTDITIEIGKDLLSKQGSAQRTDELAKEQQLFLTTGEGVYAVENPHQSSSISTIKITMETSKEKDTELLGFTVEPSKTDSRTHTNSSALTATLPNQSMEYVHTNEPIDILTGGFPCQPFSQAGRRRGTGDDRYLWGEMFRIIRETHPRWVIAENVAGLITISNGMVLEQVCLDLENEGYEVQPFIIPAVSVNAPHRRDRVWIVAHTKGSDDRGKLRNIPSENETKSQSEKLHQDEAGEFSDAGGDDTHPIDPGLEGSIVQAQRHGRQPGGEWGDKTQNTDADSEKPGLERGSGGEPTNPRGSRYGTGSGSQWNQNWLEVATRLCRVDDGLPSRLDRTPRLKALGNAIVSQVAEEIMKAIKGTNLLQTSP